MCKDDSHYLAELKQQKINKADNTVTLFLSIYGCTLYHCIPLVAHNLLYVHQMGMHPKYYAVTLLLCEVIHRDNVIYILYFAHKTQ